MEHIYSIQTETEHVCFVLNRETGRWVITSRFDKEVRRKISKPFVKRPFIGTYLIALNMGRYCNFNCKYCLVGDLKSYNKLLDEEVALIALDRIMELDPFDRHLVFHGSEPMLSFPLLKRLVSHAKRLDYNIQFSIQTNGSLFDDTNLLFLVNNNVGIGISFDGLPIHQDTTRPLKDGSPTYHKVLKNIIKVKKHQGNLSIITVVTKYNVNDLSDIIEHYEQLGIDSVLFCPVTPINDMSLKPDIDDLVLNMTKILDRYIEKTISGERTIRIDNLKHYLRNFFRPKTTSNCIQCGACQKHPLLAIDIDGSIYPCDYLWGNSNYKIGNIVEMSLKDALNSSRNYRCYRDVNNISHCVSCSWKLFCGGGCPGGSLALGGKLEESSIYCDYNRAMFTYVAKRIPFFHFTRLLPKFLELD
ncbi:MAG: radical SAM protein [Nanoarchaeota archaeon]|nr:radical SAM protein [Nanoarchaeota archaeon]MBU4124140.1 radical SAM protein [Nanoarchaeota archaeon]